MRVKKRRQKTNKKDRELADKIIQTNDNRENEEKRRIVDNKHIIETKK